MLTKRLKNIKEWLIMLSGFPCAYIIFPVSCCVRNPAAMVLDEQPDVPAGDNSVIENVGVGCISAYACLCCCGCFCGKCGSYAPKEW